MQLIKPNPGSWLKLLIQPVAGWSPCLTMQIPPTRFVICKKFCYLRYYFPHGSILTYHMVQIQVVRLLYTNSGVGLLALGSNGIQKLWKWTRNEQNPSGKVLTRTAFDMHMLISISFMIFISRYIIVFVGIHEFISFLHSFSYSF